MCESIVATSRMVTLLTLLSPNNINGGARRPIRRSKSLHKPLMASSRSDSSDNDSTNAHVFRADTKVVGKRGNFLRGRLFKRAQSQTRLSRPGQEKTENNALFGRPLSSLYLNGTMDRRLRKILTLLVEKAPFCPGIFRKPGSFHRVEEMGRILDQQENGLDLSSVSVYELGTLLKHFISQLPEGVLKDKYMYENYVRTNNIADDTARQHAIKNLLHSLPSQNQDLLICIIFLFHLIVENQAVTLFEPITLAKVVSCLLKSPQMSSEQVPSKNMDANAYKAFSSKAADDSSKFISYLIGHYKHIFDGIDSTELRNISHLHPDVSSTDSLVSSSSPKSSRSSNNLQQQIISQGTFLTNKGRRDSGVMTASDIETDFMSIGNETALDFSASALGLCMPRTQSSSFIKTRESPESSMEKHRCDPKDYLANESHLKTSKFYHSTSALPSEVSGNLYSERILSVDPKMDVSDYRIPSNRFGSIIHGSLLDEFTREISLSSTFSSHTDDSFKVRDKYEDSPITTDQKSESTGIYQTGKYSHKEMFSSQDDYSSIADNDSGVTSPFHLSGSLIASGADEFSNSSLYSVSQYRSLQKVPHVTINHDEHPVPTASNYLNGKDNSYYSSHNNKDSDVRQIGYVDNFNEINPSIVQNGRQEVTQDLKKEKATFLNAPLAKDYIFKDNIGCKRSESFCLGKSNGKINPGTKDELKCVRKTSCDNAMSSPYNLAEKCWISQTRKAPPAYRDAVKRARYLKKNITFPEVDRERIEQCVASARARQMYEESVSRYLLQNNPVSPSEIPAAAAYEDKKKTGRRTLGRSKSDSHRLTSKGVKIYFVNPQSNQIEDITIENVSELCDKSLRFYSKKNSNTNISTLPVSTGNNRNILKQQPRERTSRSSKSLLDSLVRNQCESFV